MIEKIICIDEQMTYEVYLEIAARFASKGKLKEADKALATLRKILRENNKKKGHKCTTKRAEPQKNAV